MANEFRKLSSIIATLKKSEALKTFREWTVQDGVDVTELKVYSSSGEEIEINN